jgi:arylsulfatase A-like enzyme
VILIDDLGVRDLGCTGSTFYETPNLDRMAAEGVRFTNAYAASSLCSPARAAIMTGRHPVRVDITNYIPGRGMGRLVGPRYRHELSLDERTVAAALRDGGYQTWHVGKWHLGGTGFLPTDHGFDVNLGGNHQGALYHCGYFAPWVGRRDGSTLPGLEHAEPGEYMTDRLTDESIRLIRQRRKDAPFFLHLSHYAVHMPIQSPPALVGKYEAKARRLGLDKVEALLPGELHPALHYPGVRVARRVLQSHAGYAAMMENLDWNVGRLFAALQAEGVADNTLVVFLSDNGGLSTSEEGAPTCNLPYAEGKGWSEEGGLRIPLLAQWPGRAPGGRVNETPVWQCDLYPTFLAAAGLPAEPDRHVDGVDVLATLTDGATLPRDPFCWHYPHYSNQGGGPTGAIRDGDWKLIEWYETGRAALYNLREDVSESFDLSAECPERAAALLDRLRAWRHGINAGMPVPNPHYEDIVGGRLPRPNGAGEFPAGAEVPELLTL